MKIALVHDYFYTYGGAERVLQALCEIWPKAPIYTAWVDWRWFNKLQNSPTIVGQKCTIVTSWFDKLPFKKQLCSPLRFLAPKIWSSFDLSSFDVVISSSAWYMSKGVSLGEQKTENRKQKTENRNLKRDKIKNQFNNLTIKQFSNRPVHICYCHTPPRYLYGYKTALNFKKYWWGRLYARLVNPFLRLYDFKSSQTIDWFICNSKEVQKRIKKFYRRQAKVIYPPILDKVDKVEKVDKAEKNYFLMVNRLVGPKNVDLGIRACKKLKLNLKIAGIGPDEKRLKKLTANSPYIKLLGYVDDNQLAKLYLNCKAVLYLAEQEDFGITPVEAMSFGKPVIALRSGGVKETVIEGKTGLFIEKPKVKELVLEIKKFDRRLKSANTRIRVEDCLKHAKKFSKARFKKEILKFVEEKLK